MQIFLKYFLILSFILLISCKKNDTNVDLIKETSIDLQMIDAYKKGLEELDKGDGLRAAKKFNEAELLYPQSKWAPRASLMSAYSYYRSMYYNDTIAEIERFLKTYPDHRRTNYAYYLLAMSYYEQIVDEKKDIEPLLRAKENFSIVVKNYPNTDFALDSEYKLEVIEEILASKEMYLARYYTDKEKWVPAINRYKNVLENYERSIYVEEALHRLVEIHYKIGLIDESKRYASLLGYNYQSGEWYKKSYKVFNKNYTKKKKIKKKQKNSILERFKKLLD